jgi:hypothetical protein
MTPEQNRLARYARILSGGLFPCGPALSRLGGRAISTRTARQSHHHTPTTLRWAKAAKRPAVIGAGQDHSRLAGCAQDEWEREPILSHPRSAKYKRARPKPNSYVQPSTSDILAVASPASAMGGWAEQ